MPDTETTDAATATDDASTTDEPTTGTPAPAEQATADKGADDSLGDAGKAAIAREREARKQAEREARDLKKRLDAIDAEKLSETERLQKRVEEAESNAATASGKVQRANLLAALSDEGLTGKQARAAARLLDDVQFDEDGEPTNLADALKAARATYGDDMFAKRAATAAETSVDTHPGVRQTDDGAKPESTGWFDHKFTKQT